MKFYNFINLKYSMKVITNFLLISLDHLKKENSHHNFPLIFAVKLRYQKTNKTVLEKHVF